MSDDITKVPYKYKVGDKFDFDGIVEIVEILPGYDEIRMPTYRLKRDNEKDLFVSENWIDAGIEHFSQENPQYGVSYIASASEDFKVGDRVRIKPNTQSRHEGEIGTITLILSKRFYRVGFGGYYDDYPSHCFEKLPDAISLDEPKKYEPMPLMDPAPKLFSRFKKITDEMVETYKAKNATYGNAYAEGFCRFGAVQLVSRIYEKYCRVENILVRKADNKVPDESVCDTLTDIANQCIILRMLLESQDVEFEDEK